MGELNKKVEKETIEFDSEFCNVSYIEACFRFLKYILCVIVSALILYIGSNMAKIPNEALLWAVIPGGLGCGWGVYKIIFVKWHSIKLNKGFEFWDLVILTLQSSAIFFICILIIVLLKKLM